MAGAKVFLDRLNHLNPASHYQFPTERAAERFAAYHRRRDPGRRIVVLTEGELDPATPVPDDDGDEFELLSEDDDLVGLS